MKFIDTYKTPKRIFFFFGITIKSPYGSWIEIGFWNRSFVIGFSKDK